MFESHIDPIQRVLLCFVAAFGVSYVAMRMLWAAIGANGFLRGLILGAPITALAILFAASGQPGMGVALCMGAAVLMLTLGTGVAAAGRSEFDYTMELSMSPTLRLVTPLAACACAIGFHGGLNWTHGLALIVIGGLTLWTAAPNMQSPGRWKWTHIAAAAALLATAVVLIVFAGVQFQSAAGALVVTPLVVLLAAPAILLSVMGLLSAEAGAGRFASSGDTVAGFVIASIGVAMPLVIAASLLRNALVDRLHLDYTQQPVMMPVATWRIDSLLLLVTAVLLTPAVTGKLRLGRVEGCFLVGLYLAYAAIASRAGLMG